MQKRPGAGKSATMIIPRGTEIHVDAHGQLNIRAPGNLIIENSGSFGVIESLGGSIRIEPQAVVEAVQIYCPEVCYVQGSLTAWKVTAQALRLEDRARASIVLQETQELEIGRGARLVGNFSDDKELFVLFSRFAEQLRSLPLFARRQAEAARVEGATADEEALLEAAVETADTAPAPARRPRRGSGDLPDPLFFARILLEREFSRSAYGPTSQRYIEELIKLLQERDVEALGLTYKTLCGRVVEPGKDVQRACELMRNYFDGPPDEAAE